MIWDKFIIGVLKDKLKKIVKSKIGCKVTYILIVVMIVTNLISGLALLRMGGRKEGKAANNVVSHFLDRYYSDDVIHMYFPKMKKVD